MAGVSGARCLMQGCRNGQRDATDIMTLSVPAEEAPCGCGTRRRRRGDPDAGMTDDEATTPCNRSQLAGGPRSNPRESVAVLLVHIALLSDGVACTSLCETHRLQ